MTTTQENSREQLYLDTIDAAHLLGCERQTLIRLAKRGELRAFRLSRKILFLRQELLDYVERHEMKVHP